MYSPLLRKPQSQKTFMQNFANKVAINKGQYHPMLTKKNAEIVEKGIQNLVKQLE
jgi:hypothetical protein